MRWNARSRQRLLRGSDISTPPKRKTDSTERGAIAILEVRVALSPYDPHPGASTVHARLIFGRRETGPL